MWKFKNCMVFQSLHLFFCSVKLKERKLKFFSNYYFSFMKAKTWYRSKNWKNFSGRKKLFLRNDEPCEAASIIPNAVAEKNMNFAKTQFSEEVWAGYDASFQKMWSLCFLKSNFCNILLSETEIGRLKKLRVWYSN